MLLKYKKKVCKLSSTGEQLRTILAVNITKYWNCNINVYIDFSFIVAQL